MSSVLVVGGTGWVGTRLCAVLADLGHRVTSFALDPPAAPRPGVREVQGRRETDLDRLGPAGHDAVIDLVSYHPRDTARVADALSGRAGRFVHLSTVAVYRQLTAAPATEADTVRGNGGGGDYGSRKAACEDELLHRHAVSGFPAVIVRPAPMVGPADPVSREVFLLRRLLRRRPILTCGPADGYVLTVDVDDLVRGLVAAAFAPDVEGRAYHLAHDDAPTLACYVDALAQLAGVADAGGSALLRVVGADELAARGLRLCAIPYSPTASSRLDVGRARQDLGWRPRPWRATLQRTAAWYLERNVDTRPAWPGWAATQTALCGTHEWLQADAERRFDEQHATPADGVSPDDVLAAIEGLPRPGRRWQVVPRDGCPDPTAWPVPASEDGGAVRRANRGVHTEVVVVPWAVAGQPVGPDSGWAAAAVLERTRAGQGFLVTRPPAQAPQTYADRNRAPEVRVCGFAALDASVPEPAGGRHGGPVLALVDDEADAAAFASWLEAAESAGCLQLSSLAALARVHVVQVVRWLPAELRTVAAPPDPGSPAAIHRDALTDRAPDALRWAGAPAVARLLRDATSFPDAVSLAVAGAGRPLTGPVPAGRPRVWRTAGRGHVLVRADDRFAVADVLRRRLWELPPPLARVYELALQCPSEDDAVRTLVRHDELPAALAAARVRHGCASLRAEGLLHPLG